MSPDPSTTPSIAVALAVGTGGFFGAIARYALSHIPPTGGGIPLGTLAANSLGCLLIGVLKAWFDRYGGNPLLSAGLVTGFLGALTTLSTFSHESHTLMRGPSSHLGLAYVLLTVVVGVASAWGAFELTSRMLGSAS